MAKKPAAEAETVEEETEEKKVCGLVMPISAIDGCSEAHWSDVHEILSDAAEDAGFEANLVSNADDTGIIQKRILLNLYDNPIVVCDVSGKNPNVMFELGLRLAFDKPTIIVKDDKTSYSFDTSPIEHLVYPRDLRFSLIVEFKEKLTDKIRATHQKASDDKNYTTFLKNFGEFTVAKLDKKEVSGQEYILEELRSLRQAIAMKPTASDGISFGSRIRPIDADVIYCLARKSVDQIKNSYDLAIKHPVVREAVIQGYQNHQHLLLQLTTPDANLPELSKSIGLSPNLLRPSVLNRNRGGGMRRITVKS